jgi:hypothetical protein
MRCADWYAAMSEDAVQRSRWTFYEVVKVERKRTHNRIKTIERIA